MEKNQEDILMIVKKHYGKPDVLDNYSTVGLFPSEEMLADRLFQARSTILDIGCGAGRTAIPLAKKGFTVTGIDITPEMIERAKQQAALHDTDIDFRVMDATRMTFPSESFQNIFFAFNGFDNIYGRANREKVVRDIFALLKPGGCFILTSRSGIAFGRRWLAWPLLLGLSLAKKRRGGRNYEFGDRIWKGEYYHYHSPFYVKTLVKEAGFQLVLFNSERRILNGKRASFLTNFSNARILYYVLRKGDRPGQA